MNHASRNPWAPNDRRPHAIGTATRLALVALAACQVAACTRETGVTISGDVPGLDTLGFRGDSLLAQAERGPADLLDPTVRATEGASDTTAATRTAARPAPAPSARAAAPTAGQLMSLRAQARGDSMARAIAQRLAGGGDGAGGARRDSVRGLVALVGTEPARQLVLQSGGTTIALSGMATSGLRRVVGTEVMVRGVKVTPRDIVVYDYIVRASGGVPAYDGTLDADGTLRLTDGSGVRRLPVLPPALRGLTGARVWVAYRAGSTTAAAYGVIPR
jgi:hypothetical protein